MKSVANAWLLWRVQAQVHGNCLAAKPQQLCGCLFNGSAAVSRGAHSPVNCPSCCSTDASKGSSCDFSYACPSLVEGPLLPSAAYSPDTRGRVEQELNRASSAAGGSSVLLEASLAYSRDSRGSFTAEAPACAVSEAVGGGEGADAGAGVAACALGGEPCNATAPLLAAMLQLICCTAVAAASAVSVGVPGAAGNGAV